MRKKWLINVSEEPDMINTTLDNGRSLRQVIIGVSMFLAFQAIRKSKKYVKFRLTTDQDLFQAPSSVKFGESLASALHLIQQMPESLSLILSLKCKEQTNTTNKLP